MEFSIARDKKIARSLLALFFVLYCLLSTWAIHEASNPQYIAATLVSLLWIAFLFGAIWLGHAWARYLCLILLLAATMLAIPVLVDANYFHMHLPPATWLIIALHVIVSSTLIYLPAFRTLVRK